MLLRGLSPPYPRSPALPNAGVGVEDERIRAPGGCVPHCFVPQRWVRRRRVALLLGDRSRSTPYLLSPHTSFAFPSTSNTHTHLTHRFLIFVYIVIYGVMFKNGYMLKLAPTGSIQFDLVDPPSWSKVANLSYCLQNAASERSFRKFNCTYLDGIQTRIIQGDSILVTTRVTGTVQQRQPCEEDCDDLWSPPLANDTTANNDNTYFTAEPENHKLRILHSVQQPTFGISEESRDMIGFLFVGVHAHSSKDDEKPTDAQNTLCRTHPNAFEAASNSSDPVRVVDRNMHEWIVARAPISHR